MQIVVVASKNPVKINAVKGGFEKMFPGEKFVFKGVSLDSGVSDQPMSDAETKTGAINRSSKAKEEFKDADFWVGIEGGLEKKNEGMEAFAWVAIENKSKVGKSRTSSFFLPRKISELVEAGKELGEADDIVFRQFNSKQKMGAVGNLTGNVITRTSYYEDAVCLALIPFRNASLY